MRFLVWVIFHQVFWALTWYQACGCLGVVVYGSIPEYPRTLFLQPPLQSVSVLKLFDPTYEIFNLFLDVLTEKFWGCRVRK